jgi:homoserine O-acetyltransferase
MARSRTLVDDAPDSPLSVGWTRPQRVQLADPARPLRLVSGAELSPVTVEYEQYGALNADASNAILICHALSGDAHVAGWDAEASDSVRPWRRKHPGWWDAVIGPGKPIDTRRFCVICSNVLGSCYGSTGPGSLDPATGQPYGLRFPLVTVADWVSLQARLVDHLGIRRLYAVIGGSLGGQQALEWALAHPERVARSLVFAASPRLSSQGLAFNTVGRHAIFNDSGFAAGDYYGSDGPAAGLAVARMMAHITYLSDQGMEERFGRKRAENATGETGRQGFGMEFEVEGYLRHQGRSFVERFDANSYCYITRAMDEYDAAARWGGGDLVEACRRIQSRLLITSFSSDWLYTPDDCRALALAMCRAGKPVSYVDVPSRYGHDAFLVEAAPVAKLIKAMLATEDRP